MCLGVTRPRGSPLLGLQPATLQQSHFPHLAHRLAAKPFDFPMYIFHTRHNYTLEIMGAYSCLEIRKTPTRNLGGMYWIRPCSSGLTFFVWWDSSSASWVPCGHIAPSPKINIPYRKAMKTLMSLAQISKLRTRRLTYVWWVFACLLFTFVFDGGRQVGDTFLSLSLSLCVDLKS